MRAQKIQLLRVLQKIFTQIVLSNLFQNLPSFGRFIFSPLWFLVLTWRKMSNLKPHLNFNAWKFFCEQPQREILFKTFSRNVATSRAFHSSHRKDANRKTSLNNEGTWKSLLLHFYRKKISILTFLCKENLHENTFLVWGLLCYKKTETPLCRLSLKYQERKFLLFLFLSRNSSAIQPVAFAHAKSIIRGTQTIT